MKAILLVFAVLLCCCYSANVLGGYTQVSPANIQKSATIQSLANYGGQNIVQQALAAGKLPNSNANFKLTKINSVYQQVVNGINYKFDVTLTNSDNGVILNANFVVYYQPSTGAKQITSSSYNIPTYSLAQVQNAPSAAKPAQNAAPTTKPAQTVTATSTPAKTSNPTTQAGGWTLVSPIDVQNSATIKSLADFGAQYVAKQAIADKKVPSNSKFTVSKINSVYQQVVSGINYKFNVVLTNADKSISIVAAYIVYYQSWTNTRQVLSSSYKLVPK